MNRVYIAPLRHAVIMLARKGRAWTIDAMAALGAAKEQAAKCYANKLADQSILVSRPDGLFQTGPNFSAWEKMPTKTRPGGHRRQTYKTIPANAV